MRAKRGIIPAIVLLLSTSLTGCRSEGILAPSGEPDTIEGDWMAVTAGRDLTCALTREGAAYCWGANYAHLLGIASDQLDVPTPSPVQGGLRFQAISAGYDHVCALTIDGVAYCWGSSAFGKRGNGVIDDLDVHSTGPTPVTGGITFRSISAGFYHTCGVSRDGAAYCWGSDTYGALGVGGTGPCATAARDTVTDSRLCDRTEPIAVAGGISFTSISAGDDYTCGVAVDGNAYCWGDNHYGALGNPGISVDCASTNAQACTRFVPVPVAGGLHFSSVSAGTFHSCGVTTDARAYCWGLAGAPTPELHDFITSAPLGAGVTAPGGSRVPAAVSGGLRFRAVSARWQRSCGTTLDAHAYCWGDNSFGDLGLANMDNPVAVPRAVRMPSAQDAPALGHEDDHACALTTTGRIFCWGGYNFSGELGTGKVGGIGVHAQISNTPAPVVAPNP